MCYDKSLDQIPPFVWICINYFQAIISTKLMKFTVLCTATMKGGKQLLRKSSVIPPQAIPDVPLWRSRTDHEAHLPELLKPLVAEKGDLEETYPNTVAKKKKKKKEKAVWACGCSTEDHRFYLESCSPSVAPSAWKEELPAAQLFCMPSFVMCATGRPISHNSKCAPALLSRPSNDCYR